MPAPDHSERRKFPRYSYNIGVEIRTDSTKAGYWGNVDDISLGGCYIKTFSPLPLGTSVTLRLKTDSVEILTSGIVATFHPGVGMGVQFNNFISPDGETQLRTLVATLERGG